MNKTTAVEHSQLNLRVKWDMRYTALKIMDGPDSHWAYSCLYAPNDFRNYIWIYKFEIGQ